MEGSTITLCSVHTLLSLKKWFYMRKGIDSSRVTFNNLTKLTKISPRKNSIQQVFGLFHDKYWQCNDILLI